jgi:hypothetical protein
MGQCSKDRLWELQSQGGGSKDRLNEIRQQWIVAAWTSWETMYDTLAIMRGNGLRQIRTIVGMVLFAPTTKGSITTSGDSPKALGKWVSAQETAYGNGNFKEERKGQLNEIGLRWSVAARIAWDTMYDTLCHFARENALLQTDPDNHWDGTVPKGYITNLFSYFVKCPYKLIMSLKFSDLIRLSLLGATPAGEDDDASSHCDRDSDLLHGGWR